MARKTNEQFLKEVKALVGDEYTFIEDYKGSNLRIEALHNICGETFKVKPTEFLNVGRRCPGCKDRKKEEDKERRKREREEVRKRKEEEREAQAEPGAIVRFYQQGYNLSKTYMYATNGIDVKPGDRVVVMSSLKIGVAVVTELCTVYNKGDHFGIAQKLDI